MVKINIVGSIFGTDGYSNHTRQLANALYKLNSDIKLDVPIPENWLRLVNDNELKMINCSNRKSDVTIMIATPPYWRLALADNCSKFVGFLVFEGNKIPRYWLPYILDERVDQIWVPSKHTRTAIMNTLKEYNPFLDLKIKIVPHGVDLSIFQPTVCKRDNKFSFVCNKGWRGTSWDRGGVQYLIKAFCEEFKSNENVQLLLKLNPAYIHPNQVKQAIDNLNLPTNKPEIKVLCNDIPYDKLPEFYCMGDVFVCTTRAEAFNIPGLEAMSCGLPTIQSSYGGQLDYMTDKNSLYVNSVLECVHEDILYEGISWAIPEISSIRSALRYAYEHKEEMKEKGKQALVDCSNWTWDLSAKKAFDFLKELD